MKLSYRQFLASKKLSASAGGAVWWRVGEGKTRITYQWFATVAKHEQQEGSKRGCNFLVVCRREAFGDWQEELHSLELGWRFKVIEHPDQMFESSRLRSRKHTVFVMSHGKLARLKSELSEVVAVVDAVAYDEGWLFKNSQTQRTAAAHKVSVGVGRALILSGSVMTARNLEDIYGQLFAVNQHHPIGRTLTEFRSRYRFELRIEGAQSSRGPRWANRAGAIANITKAISDRCSIYFPTNDHRRIVEETRNIGCSSAQSKAFRELREWYLYEHKGQTLEIRNAPNLMTKCQQISDGFLTMDGGDTINFPSAKLDYLRGRVEELVDANERVVVWCAFRHSVRLLLQALQKTFPKSVGIYPLMSGAKFDRLGWKRNGRVCIGTEASGSSVNFLKDCSYAIYYSMDVHWLHMQQSQGRTNRKSSRHDTCYYSYLYTQESLDSHIHKIVLSSQREERKFLTEAAIKSWLAKS